MLYTIENNKLCVQVRDHGAELRSIKEREDETEYLWNGDPTWWRYSSPAVSYTHLQGIARAHERPSSSRHPPGRRRS